MPGGTREIMRSGDMPRIARLNRVYLLPAAAEDDGTPVAVRTSMFYSAERGDALDTRIDAVEDTITSSTIYSVSWSDLQGRTGSFDGQGAIVMDSDMGNHNDATPTGYNGDTVRNAGYYRWDDTISRWDWIAESASEDALEEMELRYRPGDTPKAFDLGIAYPGDTEYGRAVLTDEATTVIPESFTALEEETSLELRVGYFRLSDAVDPDNDAVQVKLAFYDSNKALLETLVLETRLGLLVADGRQEVFRVITRLAGVYGATTIAPPLGAVYAKPIIQFFGIDHETGADLIMLRSVPRWVEEAGKVRAEGVYTPLLDFEWPEEWIPETEVARTIFVSEGGNNSKDGRSLRNAVRSVEQARDIAVAFPDTRWSIQMYPGDYPSSGHIDMPDNVAEIAGVSSQRSVKFTPTAGNETKNIFRLGSGGMLRNLSATGWRVDDFENPTEGFLASFRPDAVIARAVYVEHCVMYRPQEAVLIPAPLDPLNGNPSVGNGPGLALADANIASPYSPFAQMMVEASTNSAPNGMGIVARGNTYVNAINMVSLWAHKHYVAQGGALLALTNCETQMGDYTMWSEGSRKVLRVPTGLGVPVSDPVSAATLAAAKASIVNAMWSAVGSAYSVDEAASRRDAGILVDSLVYDIQAGQQESTEIFLTGLFLDGVFVAPGAENAFIAGWNAIRTRIDELIPPTPTRTFANSLLNLIIATVQNPSFRTKPSEVNANPVKISVPFGGVNRRAFFRKTRDARQTIVEKELGRVVFAGADDTGRQYLIGGAIVNSNTGVLEGPPINRTINPLAMRIALTFGNR